MTTRVLGFFDSRNDAIQAQQDLIQAGIAQDQIDLVDRESDLSADTDSTAVAGTGRTGPVENFFRRLFGLGLGDEDTHYYAEGVRRGGTVVSADIDDSKISLVSDIFDRDGAVDVDQRFESFKSEGFKKYDENAPAYTDEEALGERERYKASGQFAIPVVEEEVKVGKRPVERGKVRVINRITEQPINEEVRLREEHYDVERRDVDRPVNAGDMEAFKEGAMELTERGEELDVQKEARVKEEVIIHKDVDEHVEQVHETARRADVQVERDDRPPGRT